MRRLLSCSTLLVALFGAAAGAEEPGLLAGSDYYAGANVQTDGNCPDGNCPDAFAGGIGAAHGFGLHHHGAGAGGYGIFGHRPYSPYWGLAYASSYPNGVWNYGNPPYIRDYKGPGLGCRTCSNGECLYRFYGQPDLFYNYYAWPSCTGLGAELYVSPRPVPPWVGQTFITYQPLYPHEFMYSHHRTYHRYYNGGQGLNRTCVTYWHSWLPWR
jgi:hypothetical protein